MDSRMLARIAYQGLGTMLVLGLGLLPAPAHGAPALSDRAALSELHRMSVAVLASPGLVLLSGRGGSSWLLAGAVSTLLLGVARLSSPRTVPGLLLLLCLLSAVLYLGARTLWSSLRRREEPTSAAGLESRPGPREVCS